MSEDLNLQACVAAFQGYEGPLRLTKALQQVGEAYHRNITRVTVLAMILPAVASVSLVSGIISTEVRHKLKGATEDEIDRAASAEIADYGSKRRGLDKNIPGVRTLVENELRLAFRGVSLLQEAASDGFQAWLAALVTGTWTAFEAMAEGLWEAALNACPHGLAELTGSRRSSEDDKKKIPLTILQKYNYDLSHKMGTILSEKYNFDRLEGMRLAYEDAFPVRATEVHEIMKDRALDTLALVRNLIVHNGGIVDATYLRRKSDLPSKLVGELGSAIELDGEIAAEVIRPVIDAGQKLLRAVDKLIAS
jgi:hypothetical protein